MGLKGWRGGPPGHSPAPVLSLAPCSSSAAWHIQHVMGNSSLSGRAGLAAEEWKTFPPSDDHVRELSLRALWLGEKLPSLCPPLASPGEVRAAPYPPGFCELVLDKGLFHPFIVLRLLCL